MTERVRALARRLRAPAIFQDSAVACVLIAGNLSRVEAQPRNGIVSESCLAAERTPFGVTDAGNRLEPRREPR